MPIKSPWRVDIPKVSVPTFVFTSPSHPLPENPLILDPASPDAKFFSLSSYRHWSQRFAAGLQNVGFQKGNRLLFISGNSLVYPIVFMGTLMAGGVMSGASTSTELQQLISQAAAIEPTIIVASGEGYRMSIDVATAISLPRDRVFPLDPDYLFGSLKPEQEKQQFPLADADCTFDWRPLSGPDDVSAINFTSGSSGDAKGVIVTHRNMIANAVQYIEQQKQNPFGPENNEHATWVMWTPMFHVIGQNQYCIIAPKRGLRNYIMEKLDLELLMKYTERYQATELILLPAIIIALLHHPANRKYDLSSVIVAICGGAPIRESVLKKLEDLMPNKSFTVVQGWGMTEITALGINALPTECDRYTVGQVMPNCEAAIMSADGTHELGPDQPGELWIRGPVVAQGYWKRPEKTADTFLPDGWLRTGDFGYFSKEGRWQVKDRVQDVVPTADGQFVLPTDLESILLDFPGVQDAGLTSVPFNGNNTSASAINVPRAFVVLEDSHSDNAGTNTSSNTLASIGAAFDAKVEPYQRLRGGIFEIAAVPRLPSGKIDRRALRLMNTTTTRQD